MRSSFSTSFAKTWNTSSNSKNAIDNVSSMSIGLVDITAVLRANRSASQEKTVTNMNWQI